MTLLVQELGNISLVYVSARGQLLTTAFQSLALDVYNKIDSISLEQVDKLAREDHTVVISCEMGLKYAFLSSTSDGLLAHRIKSLP